MNKQIKQISISELQKIHPTFRRGVCVNIWNPNKTEQIDLNSCSNILIFDTFDENKMLFSTVREAFDHAVKEHLKNCEQILSVDVPDTFKKYPYTKLGQLFKHNRDKKERVNGYIKNIEDFKLFLENKENLNAYYQEHYAKHENFLTKDINIFDPELNLNDSVYMFLDQLDYHKMENVCFKVDEFKIVEKIPHLSFCKSLTNTNNIENQNSVDFHYSYKTESINDANTYYAPNIDFKLFKNDGSVEIIEDCEFIGMLKQTASNYRIFIEKDELNQYINKFKAKIIASFDNF